MESCLENFVEWYVYAHMCIFCLIYKFSIQNFTLYYEVFWASCYRYKVNDALFAIGVIKRFAVEAIST